MFKSKAQKAEEQRIKQEQYDAQKLEEFRIKYGLTQIREEDRKNATAIMYDLKGLETIKVGLALSMGKSAEQCEIGYLSALVNQNFMLLRRLERLEKLIGAESHACSCNKEEKK